MRKEQLKRRLEEERSRLERVREAIMAAGVAEEERVGTGELSTQDQHPGDLGTEAFERAKELSTLQGVEERLTEVDRASERLEEGTYGRCEVCGREIPSERLEALPFTRFCVEHQAQAERETRPVERPEIPREMR